MISRRYRFRIALALFAYGVLSFNLIVSTLYRDNSDSTNGIMRTDAIAGARAQERLQFADAERHFRRVVEYAQSTAGEAAYDPKKHAWALVQLGSVLEDEGRYREAEQCYKQALRLCNEAGTPCSESAILPLSHLKDLYTSSDDVARAEQCRAAIDSISSHVEPVYLRAIERQRGLRGNARNLLADDLMKLANLYYARGDANRSEPLYAEAFAIRARHSAGGSDALEPLICMGLAKSEAGKDAAAAEILKETLIDRESQYGSQSPVLIKNLYDLGMLAHRRDRLAEADSLFSRALAIEEKCLGQDHPHTAQLLSSIADCKRDRGDFDAARAFQLRVNDIRSRVFGPESHMVGVGLLALAEIEAVAGDRAQARELCGKALDVATKASGELDPLTLECQSKLLRLSRYIPPAGKATGKGEV